MEAAVVAVWAAAATAVVAVVATAVVATEAAAVWVVEAAAVSAVVLAAAMEVAVVVATEDPLAEVTVVDIVEDPEVVTENTGKESETILFKLEFLIFSVTLLCVDIKGIGYLLNFFDQRFLYHNRCSGPYIISLNYVIVIIRLN